MTTFRLAEVIAALSLATDLGTGQPFGHQLGACLSTLRLADEVGCSSEERSEVYYVALLAHLGCSGAASYLARWVGGDEINFQRGAAALGPAAEAREVMAHMVRRLADDRPMLERAGRVVRAVRAGQKPLGSMAANLCEGAPLLAERLQLPSGVARALGQLLERWDGRGVPGALEGFEISRSVRIVRVAVDLVGLSHLRGLEAAIAALQRRRGRGYDPEIVDLALTDPISLLEAGHQDDAWEQVLDSEPLPQLEVPTARMQSVARAVGEFVDLKAPFLYGHSARVAQLAGHAAQRLGCGPAQVDQVRTAGYLHDLGRVAVPNGIWQKPGPLSTHEWERVRLHPYYTARTLERSGVLAPLASLAASHHERLDGTGYHRGLGAAQLDVGVRLLAAADAFDAMTHDRPYRPALSSSHVRAELGEQVRSGRLDKRSVDAVLEVAGLAPTDTRQGHPAGLTEREVEVLRLLARGATNREIAAALVITEKTAGHHVEHIYAKAGVSTRVGAALFAMAHDLVD